MKRRELLGGLGVGILSELYPKRTDLTTGLRWSFVHGGDASVFDLSRFGESLYFVFDSLNVVDSESGGTEWNYGGAETPVVGIAGVSKRAVHLRTPEGVVALDRADGSERWSVPDVTGTALDADTLYAVREETLAAFDKTSGSQRWETDRDGTLWKSPMVASDALLIGTTSGTVRAFETVDGTQRWAFSVSDDEYLRPIPARRWQHDSGHNSDGGTTLVWNSTKSVLYGVAARDGEQRWAYEFDSDLSWFPGVVTGSRIAVTEGVRLCVLDRETGEKRWEFTAPNDEPLSAPTATDGRFLVEGAGRVTSLSFAGDVEWQTSLPNASNAWLGDVGDEATCLYDSDGTLFVLSTRTGDLRRTYELEARLPTPPLVADETVYAATENGELFALDGTRRTLTEFVRHSDEVTGGGLVATTVLAAIAARRLFGTE